MLLQVLPLRALLKKFTVFLSSDDERANRRAPAHFRKTNATPIRSSM